jgi:hypothetical protein
MAPDAAAWSAPCFCSAPAMMPLRLALIVLSTKTN